MKCRFCDSDAVAIYNFPGGCICYPDDRAQALCEQHIYKATPIEGMFFISYVPGVIRVDKSYLEIGICPNP